MTRLRAHPLLLLAAGLILGGAVLVAAVASGDTGAAAMLPFFGLLTLLALGRYVGAERLERALRAADGRPRPPRSAGARPSRPRSLVLRGGRLIASGLATRPPPPVAGAA